MLKLITRLFGTILTKIKTQHSSGSQSFIIIQLWITC